MMKKWDVGDDMTEDEAKQKWCPFARCGNEPGCNRSGRNRSGRDFAAEPYCLGSDCMMWRWYAQTPEQFKEYGETGYCGLAGKHDAD